MESSNFQDLYVQLISWHKETHAQGAPSNSASAFSWAQAPHFNEIYNGTLAVFFQSHARLIKKYRTASDGKTTCIGNNEEAEQTAHNALIALFSTIEQGKPAPDPIAFVEQQAWAYFLEMHPAAAYPELWSPEYEKLRKEKINWLKQKYSASEADAEQAVDLGFEKVFDYARKGDTFDVSLKAYLTTTIFNAFLKRIEKARREPTSDPLPENPADEMDDDSNISNEADALWQSGYPAPDDQLHKEGLVDTLGKLISQLSPAWQTVVLMSYMEDPRPTDEEIAAAIGVTVGTMKSHHRHKAMTWLREQLARLGYGHFVFIQRGQRKEQGFRRS